MRGGAWILLLFFARFHFRRQLETIVSAVEQLWVSFLREERERDPVNSIEQTWEDKRTPIRGGTLIPLVTLNNLERGKQSKIHLNLPLWT